MLLLPLSAGAGLVIGRAFSPRRAKKKFVITGRVKRLYVVFFLVMTGISALCAATPWAVLPALWPLALPLVVALSGLLAWPIEKAISECYFRDARRKLLSNPRLVRIGITGSYGKTSVKHILGAILSEKYPTLITPASFNTPMGVTPCHPGEAHALPSGVCGGNGRAACGGHQGDVPAGTSHHRHHYLGGTAAPGNLQNH